MTGQSFRIGTRKSALATTQSKQVQSLLRQLGLECELVLIESSGDLDRTTPLYQMENEGTPGLFTKQLETALLNQKIDLAVHSLKDLPTLQPPELVVECIPKREAANDSLLRRPIYGASILEPLGLPRGTSVGTSSLRREAQLLNARPDLNVVPLRGNVPTRVEAVRSGKLDAVVLAEAGLFRLGLPMDDLVKVPLPMDLFVPAPGQGALAIEVRRDRPQRLSEALAKIHHGPTELETRVEREILRELEGGCTLPLGVKCRVLEGRFEVTAFLGILDGRVVETKKWLSFPRLEVLETNEQAAVSKTVAHFKKLL